VKRYRTDLSIIMFDIDHFKKINDTYGHQAGDFILRQISQVAKDNVRAADVVARYGGEEFVICLPETKMDKAFHSAERIREEIEKKEWIYDGKKIPVTISLGVASFRETPEDSVAQFIKDVDSALYQSKEGGRNRVTVYRLPRQKAREQKEAA
jgi:diguanylate cyclase (GGDEF)-like protein